MVEHDYKNFPELTDAQLAEIGFMSPHKQITEGFDATVIKVHDGDTITLRTDFRDFDFPLRFDGIDSPELSQGGNDSRDWLKGQIEGEDVQIQINPKNRVGKYGRLIGRVISRGLDMSETAVRLGFAVPFGKKNEGQIPSTEKQFSQKTWFK